MRTYQRQLGFTLFEVLVVIAVIAMLMSLGLFSFATAQKKARDAVRKTHLRDVSTALEQFYTTCGSQYPTPAGASYTSVICTTPGASIAMLPVVPKDPKTATGYPCPTPLASNCTANQYTVCASLESSTPNTYCVSSKQ